MHCGTLFVALVVHFSVAFYNFAQRKMGMSAEGQNKIYLPATGGSRSKNHEMQSVIDGFKIYQKEKIIKD